MLTPAEETKARGLSFLQQVLNTGDLSNLTEWVAPDFVEHMPLPGAASQGPEAMRQLVTSFRSVFPDLRFEVQDLIADGDRVVERVIVRGTHQGELFGIPPTGKEVAYSGISIHRIVDGKVVEHWYEFNTLELLQQLGVQFPPQAA